MAFRFVITLTLLLAVAAATSPETDDSLQLLQVAVNSLAKQLTSESTPNGGGEAVTPNNGASCPSPKDFPDAFFMDGAECASAAKVAHTSSGQIADEPTSKVDIEVMNIAQAAVVAVEDESAATSPSQDTITIVLRCLLNLISFAVFVNMLRRFCSKGSDASESIGEVIDDNCTALHTAAKDGSFATIVRLLLRGARVDALDEWDETPLHHAARAGAIDVCELLLTSGARIDTKNAQDWTPLVAAGSAGKRAACEWLLSHGATQGGLEESSLPPMLQVLLMPEKLEPEFSPAQVESEADLLRRVLEPKPEWEQPECMSEWELDDDDDFVPTSSYD